MRPRLISRGIMRIDQVHRMSGFNEARLISRGIAIAYRPRRASSFNEAPADQPGNSIRRSLAYVSAVMASMRPRLISRGIAIVAS